MTTPQTTYLEFQTPHYKFVMRIIKKELVYNEYHFFVGDELNPCLEGQIVLDYKKTNNRYKQNEFKAYLHKIDALEECALNDINDEYMNTYSFGKEMLDSIVFFINSQFPQIKTIKLNDKSYIPCNRHTKDTLDLLTYSIALYKKTWYEEKVNAYMLPEIKYIQYRKMIDIYSSKETKSSIPFDTFISIHIYKPYPQEIIQSNINYYEKMYNTSETFPEFFQRLSKTIKRTDKCKFFKDWLEKFIYSYVNLGDRTWYFDIYPKITVVENNPNNIIPKKDKNKKQDA